MSCSPCGPCAKHNSSPARPTRKRAGADLTHGRPSPADRLGSTWTGVAVAEAVRGGDWRKGPGQGILGDMSINLVDTQDIPPTIAIVGGGASGALVASHLLRARNARVVLIERGARIARGVAYGTTFAGHLLNVPAAGMTALPDDPAHFLRYVRDHHDASAEPTTFVPRMVYGAYLEFVLRESERLAAPGASLVQWQGEVVALPLHQ